MLSGWFIATATPDRTEEASPMNAHCRRDNLTILELTKYYDYYIPLLRRCAFDRHVVLLHMYCRAGSRSGRTQLGKNLHIIWKG